MNPVNNTDASAQAQLIAMMQQYMSTGGVASVNSDPAASDATSADATGSPAASTDPNFVSGAPALSGDMLLILMQTQSSPSGGGANAGGQAQNGFQQDFEQMVQSIQSGNVSDAQQAYANLSQLIDSKDGGQDGSSSATNPFMQALNQIGSDLQSGDISGAQQTLASMQSQHAHGGHHHHGGGGGMEAASGADSGDDTADTSDSSDSSSATIQSESVSNNPDGSTTTTITYADGSTSTTTASKGEAQAAGSSNALAGLLASLQQILAG